MEITTYKERYEQPTQTISVPEALQEKGFEVYFMPLSAKQSDNAKNNDKQTKSDNFGSKFASYFADVPLPKNANEELVIPNRPLSKPVGFE